MEQNFGAKSIVEKFQIVEFETDLNPASIKQPPKKAKFLRKNHAHLFGCQLWWFCFVWTNFAPPAHFKCFREAKFFLNNIVAPALWFFRTLHHEGWCVEQGLAFSWSTVITSFPRNARDRFSLMTQRLLNENARLGAHFSKKHMFSNFGINFLERMCSRAKRRARFASSMKKYKTFDVCARRPTTEHT